MHGESVVDDMTVCTCEDAVAVAVEAGPDDARVDAVHRQIGPRFLQSDPN